MCNIGRSQIEKQILSRVKVSTERFVDDLSKDSGVGMNPKTEEIVDQISLVMTEKVAMTHKMKNGTLRRTRETDFHFS